MKDIKLYNELMTKGMADKLFFVDTLNELFNRDITEEISCIVDFGCADGTMSRELHKFYPKALIVGYDESATQIELAEAKGDIPNVLFTTHLEKVADYINGERAWGKVMLVLSSVLHEIIHYHNYATNPTITIFEDFIRRNSFDFICIRDMKYKKIFDEAVFESKYAKSEEYLTGFVMSNGFSQYWKRWHEHRAVRNLRALYPAEKELVQFLLKRTYVVNWDRECAEDYFSFDDMWKEFFFDCKGYKAIYSHNYTLPYFKDSTVEEFKYSEYIKWLLDSCTTHCQMILAKMDDDYEWLN